MNRSDVCASSRRAAAIAVLALLSLVPAAGARQATPVAAPAVPAWTQFAVDGLVARTISDGACPDIEIDGVAVTMTQRAAPDANFATAVCEAPIPEGAMSASISGQALQLLPKSFTRVAVVGDTGCRIAPDWVQDCADPEQWPLAEISRQIAAWQPDVILHVGDYVYREAACPVGNAGCAGSPFGDTSATWDADFFGPMGSSLAAAPWIFLRGNHENCDREGMGWFRYLDPGAMPSTCQPFTEPFKLPVDGINVIIMDTAAVGDVKTTPELNSEFARQFAKVAEMTTPGSWLLTHKPVAGGILRLNKAEHYVSYATVREAVDNTLPDGIQVVISGHIHLAEAVLFEADSARPAQIIAGHGGTLLDPGETATFSGELLENPEVDAGLIGASYGWMTLVPEGDRLTATAIAVDGGQLFRVYLPYPAATE